MRKWSSESVNGIRYCMIEAAKEPKTLWIVPGAGHLGLKQIAKAEYEQTVASFFTAALSTSTTPR